MAAPNAVPGKNLTLTVGGNTYRAMTSNVTEEIGDFDITSVKDNGFYKMGVDILKCSFDFEVSVTTSDLASMTVGAEVAASWTVTNGNSFSGSIVILSRTCRAGARGGYTISGRAVFNGSYTAS